MFRERNCAPIVKGGLNPFVDLRNSYARPLLNWCSASAKMSALGHKRSPANVRFAPQADIQSLLEASAHGIAHAMPQQAELTCPKMNRLNFRISDNAFDDSDRERDRVSTWLRALAIAVLAVGAMVVGAILNDSDAIEYLRAIVARW